MTSLQAWQANPLAVSDPRGIGRLLIAKLGNMGLKQTTANGDWLPQVKDIYAVGNRFCIYEMDMLRLPRGVTKSVLSARDTLDEVGSALRRRVFADEDIDLFDDGNNVMASIGFSLVVDLQRRVVSAADLPAHVPFDLRQVPDIRYPVPLGVSLDGNGALAPLVYSLPAMGHIIFAAMTGAGKSGLLRSVLTALQFAETPDTLRLALVDPKVVEFSPWNGSPFLMGLATSLDQAIRLAKQVNAIVEERMDLFAKTRTFNLDGFNEMFPQRRMPRILFAIEEMRELSLQGGRRSSFSLILSSGAAKWRAAGVHIWLSTTDPRTDTIDADILSNSRCKIVGPLGPSLSISIIGSKLASTLPSDRPGRFIVRGSGRSAPMAFQSYRIDDKEFVKVADYICGREGGAALPALDSANGLSEAERSIFDVVMERLRGEFTVSSVFEAVKGQRAGDVRLTHALVVNTGQRWEARGWLEKRPGPNSRERVVTTRMVADLGLELPAFMAATA